MIRDTLNASIWITFYENTIANCYRLLEEVIQQIVLLLFFTL